MIRVILFFVGIGLLVAGLGWLADRPGSLVIDWGGYQAETTVFRAVVLAVIALALLTALGSGLRSLFASPATMTRFLRRRRQKQGLEALSAGMIAVGAGDRSLAAQYALQARRALPNEPLTDLLRAQTALLAGDRGTARRVYEQMLLAPETELLGLRGLYLEAEREKEWVAARQFAEKAMKRNPKLAWSTLALFGLQCRTGDWDGALETLAQGRRNDLIDKKTADRRRAVLLAGLAQRAEESDVGRAVTLALEAHELAPDLVPAAAIAGRILASRGNTAKAAAVLSRTWKRAPHPDLAAAYAFARPGDSPRDRLKRVRELVASTPHSPETPVALANAAIEAQEWDEARKVLQPSLEGALTQRICMLMARIESGERGDAGRVREWLGRSVGAAGDPAWVADGQPSEQWSPISPATGELDVYEWKVPEGQAGRSPGMLLLQELLPTMAALPTGRAETVEPEARAATIVEVLPPAEPSPPAAVRPEPPPTVEPAATTEAEKPTAKPAPVAASERAAAPAKAVPEPARVEPETGLPHAPDDPGPEPVERLPRLARVR